MRSTTSELLTAKSTTSLGHDNTTTNTLQNVKGNRSFLEGYTVVRFEEMKFLPWVNPDNIVTAEEENIARRVKENLAAVFFLIGWAANVINMAVFYKQGLKERVNLCLFALSLADGLYLIQTISISGEQLHLQFTTKEWFGPMMKFMVNNNLIGFMGFPFVSQVLSAIIASERCLCVLCPLRFQTLLQTRTMAVIIVGVYLVVVGPYFVVTLRYRIACVFDPSSGTVIYTPVPGKLYRSHKELINYLDGFVYGVGIPTFMVIIVTTKTIITAMKIRQAAAW